MAAKPFGHLCLNSFISVPNRSASNGMCGTLVTFFAFLISFWGYGKLSLRAEESSGEPKE
jgi:hypothetical protein